MKEHRQSSPAPSHQEGLEGSVISPNLDFCLGYRRQYLTAWARTTRVSGCVVLLEGILDSYTIFLLFPYHVAIHGIWFFVPISLWRDLSISSNIMGDF